jgi:hypothetical protein
MNDEVKEILISLIDYYEMVGTKKDLGTLTLERLAQRAAKILEAYSEIKNKTSASIDPFENLEQYNLDFKEELEW